MTNFPRFALLALPLLALTACYPNDPDYNRCGEGGPHAPNNPAPNADCSFLDEQWNLYSFFPRNATRANELGNQNSPPLAGSGISADLAWPQTTGSSDVVIAVLDSGILWDDRELANKVYLNRDELPPPAACGASRAYDCNGDGRLNVADYASDEQQLPARNGNGIADAGDLILSFSDSADDDANGFVDDIAGWDTFRNDNDPYDDVRFGHGTGRARDAAAQTDNGLGGAGVCPECMVMPVRIGDSFVVSGHTFSQGVVFAADTGANVIAAAVGAVTSDAYMQQALDYAWSHNVLPVVGSADEDSFHHSPPSTINHALSVKALIPDTAGLQTGGEPIDAQVNTTSFLSHAACTNYGGHIHLAVPTDSCSSGATGTTAGAAGLVYSRALEVGLSPPLTANEAKQILTRSADDINIPGSGTSDASKYPSRPGWDQCFGYGRLNAFHAVQRVVPGTIPPEADIIAPTWFDVIDPTATSDVAIVGAVSARRSGPYSYVVQCAFGVEPADAAFAANTIASATGLTAPIDGALATWHPATQCAPPDLDRVPSGPDDFTVTLRVRVTDARGNVGEDRKTVAVHHDASLLAGFPLDTPASGESSLALVDLDGDNTLEVIEAGGDGRLYAFRADGTPAPGFPVAADPLPAVDPAHPANHLGVPAYASRAVVPAPDGFVGAVAVGDIFRDGRQVIVAASLGGTLYAWHADGSRVAGFPVSVNPAFSAQQRPNFEPGAGFAAAPALGDIDPAFPGLEIVAGALDQHVYAWHADGTAVAGFPALVNSPEPQEFSADDCGENKIISSPALGDVDNDGALEIVIGTNEAFADDGNCGFFNGSGRVYVVSGGGAVERVISPHSRIKPTILPGVGNGVPASPALADLDGNGDLEIGIAAIGAQPDEDGIIFNHDGSRYGTFVSEFSGTGSTDSPLFALVANGSFGDLNGDGTPDYALGGTGRRLLVRFALPGSRIDHDHLVGAWDGASGAFLPGFPRRIEDWQFLVAPTIATLSGAPGAKPNVVAGSGGYLVHAYDPAGGEVSGWPKFTNGWVVAAAATGDVDSDGTLDVVVNTREGQLFAWRTDGDPCANDEWWRFHHDEWNSGRYGADSRRPAASRDLRVEGSDLAWADPGDDHGCGQAQQYEARVAPVPITPQTWATAAPFGGSISEERVAIPALAPGTWYFAVRATDDAGNIGALSNVVSVTVP